MASMFMFRRMTLHVSHDRALSLLAASWISRTWVSLTTAALSSVESAYLSLNWLCFVLVQSPSAFASSEWALLTSANVGILRLNE
eukprot:3605630-Heterocapsa_arctica.AAC.1